MQTEKRPIRTRKVRKLFLGLALALAICATLFSTVSHASASSNHISKVKPLSDITCSGSYSSCDNILPDWQFKGCGTGWNNAIDAGFEEFRYAYTTGNQRCSEAVWNDSPHTQGYFCNVFVYIPTIFATANTTYNIVDGTGTEHVTINQNNVSNWQYLGQFFNVGYVYITSNNGETNTYMAAGKMAFLC